MSLISRRWSCALLLTACMTVGCQSLHSSSSNCGPNGSCPSSDCQTAERWSDEWYAQAASRPEGARQKNKYGKLWPPYPRPTGEGQECIHRFHGAHYWPHPYNCWDREHLRQISDIQTANGWTRETTLYDYHFDDKNTLNHSGLLHLKWILQTIPKNRRFVWVQTADDREISKTRLQDVKATATAMIGEKNLPPILLRISQPLGRPTREVDLIFTLEMKSFPSPRIQYTTNSTESGGEDGG
ncbi:MAG: hypothetical protein IID45_10395 [Planctomycetes bacterium]|nr:hypothetical protein [Planctomycetota bacterium]